MKIPRTLFFTNPHEAHALAARLTLKDGWTGPLSTVRQWRVRDARLLGKRLWEVYR